MPEHQSATREPTAPESAGPAATREAPAPQPFHQSLPFEGVRFGTGDFLALQRSLGNRTVGGMISRRDQRDAAPVPVAQVHEHASEPGMVHRHSSWEHKLLGDANGDDLAKIGAWEDLLSQTERTTIFGGKSKESTIFGSPAKDVADVQVGGGSVKKGNVMHVLVQEMQRLKDWQTNPPTTTGVGDSTEDVGKDDTFEVVLVALPGGGKNGREVITYGELNTLADFYGDPETMKTANPKSRHQIVQSVRKETFLRLKEIYDKIEKSLTSTEAKDADVKDAKKLFSKVGKVKFKGAATPDFISGKAGQADLLAGDKPLIGQGTGAKGKKNEYGATLARNACHFVPESWHAWADYHDKGRAEAFRAFTFRDEARTKRLAMAGENYSRRPLDKQEAETEIALLEARGAKAANEAILNNGFGDHYLEDSYASGHMINKTQIMQWYVEYIDKNAEWDYFKEENWRRVQEMAYRQPGLASSDQYDKSKVKGDNPIGPSNSARNPQSVENIKSDDWTVRFDALGLQVPRSLRTAGTPERSLMQWWQGLAGNASGARTQSGAKLVESSGMGRDALQAALKNLLQDGIVRMGDTSVEARGGFMKWDDATMGAARFTRFNETKFILRDDYVPKDMTKFNQAVTASSKGDDSGYQKMAKSVSYGDYFAFMESGFIQKATNALHDTFCAGGLTVRAGSDPAFKVYGDDAMFSKTSSAGVKYSSTTANMSRDAILNIVNTGADGGFSVQAITKRFPDSVDVDLKDDSGAVIGQSTTTIEKWHNPSGGPSLQAYCDKDVFPKMSWSLMQKMIPGVAGSSLGTISPDQKIHGADAF